MDRRRHPRPNQIEVQPYYETQARSTATGPRSGLAIPTPTDQPSPRAGDVAPNLSPLDAFAMQGRMLARRFEEDSEGRRISRLPPGTVASEFHRSRPAYYPAYSPRTPQGDASFEPSGASPEVNKPDFRPQSYYPQLSSYDESRVTATNVSNKISSLGALSEAPEPTVMLNTTDRSESPEAFLDAQETQPSQSAQAWAAAPELTAARPYMPRKSPTNDSNNSATSSTLAPPSINSPANGRSPRLQPSIRSVRSDSGDDIDALPANDGRERMPSISSGQSRPRSPFSPIFAPRRSPSISSEMSAVQAGLLPRRSQNFSRPMSPLPRTSVEQSGRPSGDAMWMNPSVDSPRLRPSFDALSIQDSLHSPAFPHTPTFDSSAAELTDDEQAVAATREKAPESSSQSYIYSKYTLPRGRVVSRASISAADFLAAKFEWDSQLANVQEAAASAEADSEPKTARLVPSESTPTSPNPNQSNTPAQTTPATSSAGFATQAPQPDEPNKSSPSPDPPTPQTPQKKPDRKSRFVEANLDDDDELPLPKLPSVRPSSAQGISARPLPSLSNDKDGKGAVADRPTTSGGSAKKNLRGHKSNPSFPPPNLPKNQVTRSHSHNRSRDDLSLIPNTGSDKLMGRQEPPTSAYVSRDQISPETHLAKGIASHETGQLQKSTYHLRIAARAGLPTAMLLYGLAARHGWGMRANQSEAVIWLRKAVDSAGFEVAEDERSFNNAAAESADTNRNAVEAAAARKAHKSQLALAIYELGVSYMNGWGTSQDRSLALRCFEIAGGWGDADALAEAGFCYAKGLGCKKDLKRAASLYRQAEQKGISMAGNSWIYKEKYMAKEGDDRKGRGSEKEQKEKKPRDKSRTRTFFGGRRKTVTDRDELP